MKREIAMRWIAALRSGEYRQTNDKLCRIYNEGTQCSHCAMGVLADLYQRETGELNTWPNKDGYGNVSFKDETNGTWSSIFIPTEVKQWAGIRNGLGAFKESQWIDTEDRGSLCCTSVVALNDDARLPFTDIADIIEQNWEDM